MSTNLLLSQNACGRDIIITRNGVSARATVVDMCNEAHGCRPNNIDGTTGLWAQLGINLDIGLTTVSWRFA